MTTAASAQTFELLTPCFCAGVSKTRPEMRIASIRGQLRWWARVLFGAGKAEYELFGGIRGKAHGYDDEGVASSFKFNLRAQLNNPGSDRYMMVPHKTDRWGQPDERFKFDALSPHSRYTLEWMPQAHPDFRDKPDGMLDGQTRRERFERVLKAWLLLGAIGRRATRAAGSVWPVGYQPSVADFNAAVVNLNLYASVKVGVLNAATMNPTEDAEALRDIADMTVHGLKRSSIEGDPLGFVSGTQRKASPLRFKVGHFNDGHRIIAIWDNRDSRGGSLSDAKAKLSEPGNGNQLATWLTAAGF